MHHSRLERFSFVSLRNRNLRADEALDLLKEQFGQYYRGEAPFNRPVIGDEGPREWWEALNCDRSHRTQPIAQLMTGIFGVTPNSMSDERTASYFTWQNSHLRGSQKVSTLVRMAQVRQYKKMQSLSTRAARRPTVRFRDLNSTIRRKTNNKKSSNSANASASENDTAGSDSAGGTSSSESDSDSDSGGEGGDSNNVQEPGRASDSEFEEFDWDTAQTRKQRPYDKEPSDRLVVEEIANLNSHTLRDLLSDEPVTAPSRPARPVAAAPKKSSQPRILQESDWSL
ncbi:hypothetical protein BC629DRAFT_1444986 [Irpex lacteus]|nr:hypothetical protein BC629DRAFT_1444986 [Irpex lacteus]